MKLTNRFVVDASREQVWALFDELDRVVPCMPGASYLGCEGQEHRVAMKVKIGAILSDFQGTVSFVEKDEADRVTVMRGMAKDTGGKGSAAALIETRLSALSPHQTQVDVSTDLNMAGRLAQFGGPIVADIAQRLVQQFTANLHEAVLAPQAQAHAAAEPSAAQAPVPEAATAAATPAPSATPLGRACAETQPLDLGAVVGQSLWKLVGPYALVLVVGFAMGWLTARLW